MSTPDVPTPAGPPLQPSQPSTEQPGAGEVAAAKKRLARDVAMFSVARIGLVVVLAAAIMGISALLSVSIPLIVAFLIAVVAALPLSILLFNGLRKRVNEGIVVVDSRRRAEKDELRARLRGENESDDDAEDGWEQRR